jgi:hypothetical protein
MSLRFFALLLVLRQMVRYNRLQFYWLPNSVWERHPRNSVSRLPHQCWKVQAKQSFAKPVPKQSLGTRKFGALREP